MCARTRVRVWRLGGSCRDNHRRVPCRHAACAVLLSRCMCTLPPLRTNSLVPKCAAPNPLPAQVMAGDVPPQMRAAAIAMSVAALLLLGAYALADRLHYRRYGRPLALYRCS